jgi:hypothetical protein
MKKALLSLLLISTMGAYCQTPSLQWEKNVNGQLSGYDNTLGSWKDSAGNFLITGNSNNDAFLLKIDNNGNQLLKLIYDGPQSGSNKGVSVRGDAAGNIYMGGLTPYNSYNVPFVVKYNSSGVKQWEYIQTNVAVSGTLTSMVLDNYDNPANLYFTGSKNDSSAIIKLNTATGVPVWEKTLWPHGKMNDIDIDNNGHPLVCGYQAFTGKNADFYAAVLDVNTGYPLRGFWQDGSAVDSVDDPNGHFDMASKIKAGPAGSFVVLGSIYNSPTAATIFMVKFGSTGNVPAWSYSYNSPNHTNGNGVQLMTDVSFSNFYYLAGAMSTSGTYYGYTIAGKVNNSGTALWVQEFNKSALSLTPHDMALDANGNAHIISDMGYPGDIFYQKLASTTGVPSATLQYDNKRGGGNAYDYSSNIFLDITGHPYITGSSNALTYTNLDVLVCHLNTDATLDWDITYDFFVSSPNAVFNVQTVPTGYGTDQIITCGKVVNNITSSDVSITSYAETGAINWQATFDDNDGGDQVIGFEKSPMQDLFLCSYNNSNSSTSITEFYRDGTTNFSIKPSWTTFTTTPTCFKIDTAENSFLSGPVFGFSDFSMGIFLRTGTDVSNVPTAKTSFQTNPKSITTDNTNIYIAGTLADYSSGGTDGLHAYIQKYDLTGKNLWSVKITGFDSSANTGGPTKIVFDRASGALYVVGTAVSTGSSIVQTFLAKINVNGTVAWVKKENASNTRYQYLSDITVTNNKIYLSGYAYNTTTPNDHLLLSEKWDVNGNKLWEYTFDKTGTDEEGPSIAVDNAGHAFIGGTTNGSSASGLNGDMLLIKLDTTGKSVWEREYNGVGNANDYCANIALSNSHSTNPRIYMCGNTQTAQGSNYDIATLKYCDLPVTSVAHSGGTSICQNSSLILNATGIATGTIVWEPGASSASTLSVSTTGSYYFSYTETDGCSENSDTVSINFKAPPAVAQICMVTVDSLSTHNIIYWDKTSITHDVVGFKMYREDLTNIYTYLGSVPMDSLSEYHDYGANPNVTTKRYKITAIDSCGNESVQSNYHNTIYIVDVGAGKFTWNPIYTIENSPNPVSNYVLMRDDNNTGNFQQIASTAGTQSTITDTAYIKYPNANWRVDALGFNCNPTYRLAGNNNSTFANKVKSHSNQSNNRVAGISQLSMGNRVSVYPNPSAGSITILNSQKTDVLKITDVLGNVVYETALPEQKVTLQLDNSGVYFITIISGKETTIKKVIISN